jgi:hypothetical protein
MMNVSVVSNDNTASTNPVVAHRRAENLAILGVEKVIELCVGPSLKTLERAYRRHNISVSGNDIDKRWQEHYPEGNWIIGDALTIPLAGFDTAVLAPPLSRGCTGRREDSLSINEVFPAYRQFLLRYDLPQIVVLVLPGRTFSVRGDRAQFYALMSFIMARELSYDAIPMLDARGRVTKYIDVYIRRDQ